MNAIRKETGWLRPDPDQPRKHFNEDDLRRLGESLKKKQLVPILVRPDGTIIDGERRYRAALLVGLTSLFVIIVEGELTDGRVREMQLITALHRADLTPFELFGGCKSWQELHPGATVRELASAIDLTESYVGKVLSLDRCIQPVKDAAQAGKIGVSDWYILSQLPEGKQAEELVAKLNGASRDELIRRSRQSKRADQPAVRASKIKCPLPSGVTITASGDDMSLEDFIEALTLALKEAKKALDQGLDSKTFAAVARDKAKAG